MKPFFQDRFDRLLKRLDGSYPPEKSLSSVVLSFIGKYFLVLAAAIIFVGLLLRNTGLYPLVFADEYSYSKLSRLIPLKDSTIPSYIYLFIFRLTNICGDGFLECARILNALLFVSATPFIYLTARQVCTKGVASIVVLLALLGPINSYTAYFMPEALYFFSFWVLTWFILRLDNTSSLGSWFFGGILLGLLALIKPHSLLLSPAAALYILFVSRKKESAWALQAFGNVIVFVVSAFFTKLSVGYLFAGAAGSNLFGSYYAPHTPAISSFESVLKLLPLAIQNIEGHLLGICLMFCVPIASAIIISIKSLTFEAERKSEQKISIYSLLVLGSMILVLGLFSASNANSGPYETIGRISMRHYDFAFPLLLLITASQLSPKSTTIMFKWRATTAVPIGAAILYAIFTHLAPYTPNIVDCPELFGFTLSLAVFYLLSGLSLLSLVLWIYATRTGARFFIYLFVPLAVFCSTVFVSYTLRGLRGTTDAYDKAGLFTKRYLPNEDIAKVHVVGSEVGSLFRSLFYLDNPNASLEAIPRGSTYDLSKFPTGKEWILVIGDHPLPQKTYFQLPMNGFVLARVTGMYTLNFKQSAWPGIVSRTQGLSPAEAWGTFSSGNLVTLEFSMPLPERFALHLVASAFGPNVGKDFVARVGDGALKFKLKPSAEERVLRFDNPKEARTISIDVPSAISPRQLGLSADERKLGIAFFELRIEPL